MIEAAFPLFASAFGSLAGGFLRSAAEQHVVSFFGKGLDRLAQLGGKDAMVEVMERAYAAWFEMILANVKGLGYEADDLVGFEEAARKLIEDFNVAEELLKPVVDPGDKQSPEPEVLREAWQRLLCPPLPVGFSWQNVVAGYRLQVERAKVMQPKWRERLTPELLIEIRDAQRHLAGVTPSADIARYAARMRQKYQVLDLSAMLSPTVDDPGRVLLRQAFLPQRVREDPPPVELPRDLAAKLAAAGELDPADLGEAAGDERLRRQLERLRESYVKQPPRPVLDIVGQPAARRLVILGGAGSGKSTLARYLLLSLLDPPEHHPVTCEPAGWVAPLRDHLPLLVELREYHAERQRGGCDSFISYFEALGREQGYALNAVELDARLKQGPSLVLFDGLDEVFDPQLRDNMAHSIVGFAHDYPQARVVVTSRPVGYRDKVLRDAEFRHFAVEDFDSEEIERFVRGWFALVFPGREKEAEQRVDRVLRAVRGSSSIKLLAGNPLLLTIMTLIAQLRELPRERWRFYDYAAEVLCHHWDVNRHLEAEGVDAEYMGVDDKKELLRRIAFRMQGGEGGLGGNFIYGDDLQTEIKSYLIDRLAQPPSEATRGARVLIDQLRERNYILCLRGPKLYGFVHRTFLEYFCAAELVERLKSRIDFTVETLRDEFYAPHWPDPAWAEPLRLVCGMVGEELAEKLIDFLVGVNPRWLERYQQEPPRNLALATQCLAEVRNIRNVAEVADRLLMGIVKLMEYSYEEPYPKVIIRFLYYELFLAVAEIEAQRLDLQWLAGSFHEILRTRVGNFRFPFAFLTAIVLKEDNVTRDKFFHIARYDSNPEVRGATVSAIASIWPDKKGRYLIRRLAADDPSELVRLTAVSALASSWPEETSRELICDLAAQDASEDVRSSAVSALASNWPEQMSRDLIRALAAKDASEYVRSTAARVLAQKVGEEIEIALSKDLTGREPYLDPLDPLPGDHLHRAAEKLRIDEAELRRRLAACEDTLGWNPLEGLNAKRPAAKS